ncbi:putative mitochondrial carrier [Wickerhamomyces ciferrii]|uniref:Mitochondrial carrier n=1 Tax=Wickerhamomyces ciferrii (strain ATCC 14091 / BCRC 22168 / CBS 111 / JCM 3599 / NBRC 0793 / NRRL Y-1031 F-60-10) TaxID=1206466 RepID=K0KXA9_WICCF|nr:putative mitochondrial carrier [Wickerhamomyces ciferrii]CCH45713.1 putative mitochondrial carrier [Wickerhamomyces ciferrii]
MTELLTTQDHVLLFIKRDSTASFISGGLAGAISRTVVSPFERAKILFQVQGPGQANYNGMFKTIWQMWKDEGTKGLFRGNALNCIRIFPYSAVQFYVYQKLKFQFLQNSNNKELGNFQRLFSGGIAGTLSVAVTYPLDLVRTRLSIQTANLSKLSKSKAENLIKPPGFWELLKNIYKNEGGFWSLYRGIWPTTLGVAPYVAINFAVYEQLKELVPNSSATTKLFLGAIAGGVAQTLTYPFDLLRRRFQVLTMGQNELGFKYKSVSDALITIFKTEGFFGAYKGLTANLFKVIPSMAVSWWSYELIKTALIEL